MPRKVHNCSTWVTTVSLLFGTTVGTTRVRGVYEELFNTVQHCVTTVVITVVTTVATTVATTVPGLLSCI